MNTTALSIIHHPDDDLLFSFAGGNTDQAFNLIIAQHLHNCTECSYKISQYQDICADFFFEQTNTQTHKTDDDSFNNLWNKIHSSCSVPNTKQLKEDHLSPLDLYLKRNQTRLKLKNIVKGIKETILPMSTRDVKVSVMKLAAGTKIPQHTHQNLEMTLVLSGGFFDDTGNYNRGDLVIKTSNDTHNPQVFPDEPCECFVVRYGDLKFTGTAGLFLNSLYKIID